MEKIVIADEMSCEKEMKPDPLFLYEWHEDVLMKQLGTKDRLSPLKFINHGIFCTLICHYNHPNAVEGLHG